MKQKSRLPFKGQHEVSVSAEVSHVGSSEGNCEYNSSLWTVEQLSTELNSSNACLTGSDRKITVPLTLNGKSTELNLDTGAVVSCVGENTFKTFCKPDDKLSKTDLKLTDYNKKPIEIVGVAEIKPKIYH